MHITDECDGAQGGQIMILEEALALETPLEYCEIAAPRRIWII